MVEVTEADKKLLQDLAINLGNGGSRHNREQLVATHREAAAKAERGRLDNIPVNWELTWGPVDDDDGSPCAWLVFSRSGGRSDKEWTLLATGETPTQVITAALESQP